MRGVIVALSVLLLAGGAAWGFLPGIEDFLGGSQESTDQPTEVPTAVYVVGEASDGSKIFEGWMEPGKNYTGVYRGVSIAISTRSEFDYFEGTWSLYFDVYYPDLPGGIPAHNVGVNLNGEVYVDPEGSSWRAVDVRWESQGVSQEEESAGGLLEAPMPIDNIILKLAKFEEKHFSVHVWGKDSAPVDMEIARRIKDAEIEIGTDGSTLGNAVGMKVVPYAGVALSQAACQWHKVEDIKSSVIPGITFDMDMLADSLTNVWMNLKDSNETIPNEEQKTLFLVSYGGPAVNQHAQRYAMDKELPLYFDKDADGWKIVDRITGKEYRSGEYGLVLAIPRVRSVSLPELYMQIEQYDGQILLYRVIIAGNTRVGTRAAGDWYATSLELSNRVLERISDFVCGGIDQEQLAAGLGQDGVDYLLNSVSLEDLGEMQQAVEGYVKVMVLTSLDKKTAMPEVPMPGYAALIKAEGERGKLVKIYPLS
ncbi:hypothetical protein [Candidatus Pyrohabitans sp.]